MSKRIEVKKGDRYGRWIIISEGEKRKDKRYFVCKCDCGKESTVRLGSLRMGDTQSCGCLQKEMAVAMGKKSLKHGKSRTRLYQTWSDMKHRCSNPKYRKYENYGGRGISICTQWEMFENFHKWAIGSGYAPTLTIERINNNGNYEPSNCKWIPKSIQIRNQRRNRRITYNGRTQILTDWAQEVGLKKETLFARLRLGWSIKKALTTPLYRKFSHGV